MKILKFGGTSIGSPARMKDLLKLISLREKQLVVLSAIAGTTNALVEICKAYAHGDQEDAQKLAKNLHKSNELFIEELFDTQEGRIKAKELAAYHDSLIASYGCGIFGAKEEKIILAQGELLSTGLFLMYLQELDVPAVLLPALDFMKIDEDNEPMPAYIQAHLQPLIDAHPDQRLFITQGFICRNAFGEIDNLQRGGSDYTASLIGAALLAEEIQIWTDIDGMHNNDPRIVSGTKPIAQLSFEEAAELAYFGAKVLHPQSVFPAQKCSIPVRLLNTLQPTAAGTRITTHTEKGVIKSVAAKDGISAIRIQSGRMLLAYGFLRRVFEVFERYKTPIDMITTSEVAVSLTIDNTTYLDDALSELRELGAIEVDHALTIVCIVGDFSPNQHGCAAQVLESVKHVPVRMISYGGSPYNISLLIDTSNKVEVLKSLHRNLFA